MGGEALVPVRTDIVGNLLVYTRATGLTEKVAGFIANLRRKLNDNGLRFEDCVSGGVVTIAGARSRLEEAKRP